MFSFHPKEQRSGRQSSSPLIRRTERAVSRLLLRVVLLGLLFTTTILPFLIGPLGGNVEGNDGRSLVKVPAKERSASAVLPRHIRHNKKQRHFATKMHAQQTVDEIRNLLPRATSAYAYIFVMGGIHEERGGYHGFLYNILIAAHLLQKFGSAADMYVYCQLSPDSKRQTLLDEDSRLLESLNVTIVYLPKPATESFASVVYEKFRGLTMTQYSRVIFLDADAIPLANLDYIFEKSVGPDAILKPNLIVASRGEPCNAGLFMLAPAESAWDDLKEVIRRQHESAKDLPYPKFDRSDGWGHNFQKAGDKWDAVEKSGVKWKYHASHSDQGLLYYWVKYHQQNVSLVIGESIENWSPGPEGKPVLTTTMHRPLDNYTSPEPAAYKNKCDKKPSQWICAAPHRDYAHFMGGTKPWQKKGLPRLDVFSSSDLDAAYRLWFRTLEELNGQLGMGLNLTDLERWQREIGDSPLGTMAMWRDHAKHVEIFHNKTDGGQAESAGLLHGLFQELWRRIIQP